MPCRYSLNVKNKGLNTSLEVTDARNCHRSSRLCIAHISRMMSTVLSVNTSPVRNDSTTRAGMQIDVSSPFVTSWSDRQGKKGTTCPASAPKNYGKIL